jgi:hypothetical protein
MQGMSDRLQKPTHPYCPTCDLPMLLVKTERGAIADQFECKVCGCVTKRAEPRE